MIEIVQIKIPTQIYIRETVMNEPKKIPAINASKIKRKTWDRCMV